MPVYRDPLGGGQFLLHRVDASRWFPSSPDAYRPSGWNIELRILGNTHLGVHLEIHTWEYTPGNTHLEIHTWRYTHGDTLIHGGVENNENHQEVARTFSPKTWTRIAFVWGGPPPLYFWVGGLSLRASESNESNHARSAWNMMEPRSTANKQRLYTRGQAFLECVLCPVFSF